MARPRASADPQPSFQEHWHDVKGDYQATKHSALKRKRTGFLPTGSDADYHLRYEWEFFKLMELARDVDRNDMVVGQAVTRYCQQVLQGGIPVDPQTGDSAVDDMLLEEWENWGADPGLCHSQGRLSWREIEHLALRQSVIDGDNFIVPIADGTVETFEAHRCRTPMSTVRKVVHGVLLDDRDRPKQYWFTRNDLGPGAAVKLVADIVPYDAWDADGNPNVFHVLRRRRSTQTRGVTSMAPIMDAVGLHDDTQFAELVRRQVQSCITFLRELPAIQGGANLPQLDANGVSLQNGTAGETELRASEAAVDRLLQHVFPGMEIVGKPGEKLNAFSPQPGQDSFRDHVLLILGIVAVNLEIPLQVLLLDATMSNLSSWRGVQDLARTGYREAQAMLIQRLSRPTYLWRVRWLLSLGESDVRGRMLLKAQQAGVKIFRHVWTPQSWGYIDPLKDSSADLIQQSQLLNSPRRLQAKKGQNWFQIIRETVEDNEFAIEQAILSQQRLRLKYPEEAKSLTWREVLQLTNADKFTIVVGDTPTGDQGAGNATGQKGGGGGTAD